MFHLIPPAGTPISFRDIIQAVNLRLLKGNCSEQFENAVKNYTNAKYCYFFNSGRTALVFILKALSKQTDDTRNEVVIPAYTCFSVPAAIARSGLKIRLVDIDPMTMDYNYDKLSNINFTKVLAIVASNLFGIISDWQRLWSIARDKGIFLIDDAAQSMGSSYEGKPSGVLGDVGFYSLGRGKNMSTYSGGILVTDNDKIALYVENNMKVINKPGLINETCVLLKIILYILLLRPRLYWLPAMIPFLGLGETVFDKDFDLKRLTYLQICAGAVLMDNLMKVNVARAKNAHKLAESLLKMSQYMIPGYDKNKCPFYLRLPLLCSDKTDRDKVEISLKRQGIVASTMYPSTIRQIPGVKKFLASNDDCFPGAQIVVDKLISLPTHPYLTDDDILKITSCLFKG